MMIRATIVVLALLASFVAGFVAGDKVETNYCKSYYAKEPS